MATMNALTPSQAIRSVSGGGNDGNQGNPPRGRQRRRTNNNKKKTNKDQSVEANSPSDDNKNVTLDENRSNAANNTKGKPRNNKKKGSSNNNNQCQVEDQSASNGNGNKPQQQQQKKKKNNRKKNSKNRKRFPWRKYIPAGTVDPITLENLISLPYPPFALRAAAPYLPVPEWPPKEEKEERESTDNNNIVKKEVDAKERERRLLQEQWGDNAVAVLDDVDNNTDEAKLPAAAAVVGQEGGTSGEVNPKHLNLFDGRALAYYMVSQLQFIDPLNRRDLTRDELCHLDRYLVRNNFTDLNVVEAYDTKGVSLSTAGAAANSAAGRAEILQQEARVLLNALFGGGASLPASTNNSNRSNNNNNSNSLMQQYSNYQAAQSHQPPQNQYGSNPSYFTSSEEAEMGRGIYGDEDGGLIVVDDDEARVNSNMRGTAAPAGLQPYHGSGQATLWSPGHITTANASNLQPQNFPALSTANTLSPGRSQLNSEAPTFVPPGAAPPAPPAETTRRPGAGAAKKKPLPPAKSLSLKFITNAVKKTTPEETQRQFEAREEARRKAMLSNLTFGSNPASWNTPADTPSSASSTIPQPTEGMIERNRALAEAFGLGSVSSSNGKANSWARPTNIGNNVVLYPDALIFTAREKMGVLVKLERKWKAFLEDDKAASLPLNNMDRDTRAFVHQYSDFWKLHTESFDKEPKRYIHCVKLMDTCSPYPLLSDAARDWRGPTGRTALSMPEHASQQTAGQETRGIGPLTIDLPSASNNPRATVLMMSERPKLQLKERTLPLELPPFQPPPPSDAAAAQEEESEEQIRRRKAKVAEKERREQEREERRQKALEAAFDSEDEEESLKEMDADSDWEQGEALYDSGSDEEF